MSEEFELKPCPLCGGKAEFHRQSGCTLDYIICTKCELYLDMEKFDSIDELINHWNHRPSPWISVEKDFPRLGEVVFIAIGELPEYDIGALTDFGWIMMNHPLSSSESVKYFMRKPELPKE